MKNMQLRMLIIATTTTTADESEAMMNDERNILRRFEFDAKMTEITRERVFLRIFYNITRMNDAES